MTADVSGGPPLRVLLIEDNPGDARLFEELLGEGELDGECRWEASLEAGLEAARADPPDIIAVDLGLPDSEGLETVRRLTEAGPDVPLVVTTGLDELDTATEALEAGASEYLRKDGLTAPLLSRTLRMAIERHRLEREADRYRERSRSILESLPDHIAVLGADGTILATNEAWRAFTESEGDSLRGHPGDDYLEKAEATTDRERDDARRLLAGLQAVLRGNREFFRMEYPCHGPDQKRWFKATVVPLRDEERSGAVVSHSNVTERKLAEIDLEVQRERLAEVFENTPSWVATLRGPNHVFEMANPAYHELVGERDVIGRPAREVFPELEGEGYFELLDRVYESGVTVEVEERPLRLETSEGMEHKYITFVYQPRREDGEVVGIVAHGVDVTEQVKRREEARTAEQRYRTLFSESPVGIAVVGTDGRPVEANSVLREMLGYDAETLTSMAFPEFTHPEDVERDIRLYEKLLAGEIDEYRIQKRFLTTEGDILWGDLRVAAVRLPGTDERQQVAFLTDITEQREREEALRRSEARYRTLVETMAEATVIVDPSGRVVFANNAAEELLGLEKSELNERTYDDLEWKITAPDGGNFPEEKLPFRRVMETGRPVQNVEHGFERPDGERRVLSVNAAPLRGRSERLEGVVATMRDVTERRRMEEQLRHRALHDVLTGLANRSLLMDRLDQALARARRRGETVGVLVLDLDRFKQVNDHLGHAAGDRLLTELARRLEGAVRDEDTVARLGGDEFAVVLPSLEERAGLDVARDRLLEAATRPYRIGGREVEVDVTAGAVLAGSDGLSAAVEAGEVDDVLRYADLALYHAKERAGPSFHLYRPSADAETARQLSREQTLREAIREEDFRVDFQPIVRVDREGVWGAEPLARWEGSDRGGRSPAEFIALAEETGLIHELGELLLRETCRHLAEWPEELRRALTVTPNLSGRQFDRDDFVPTLRRIIEEEGLDPSLFEFEVTENTIIRATGRIRELRSQGFGVVIDDFGTGFSSFHYFRDLTLEGLKIDRSFIHGIEGAGTNRALVQTMINMGKSMGMTVVAEGVETEEQRAVLRELGCPLGQGYLFARPMAADRLPRWLAEREEASG